MKSYYIGSTALLIKHKKALLNLKQELEAVRRALAETATDLEGRARAIRQLLKRKAPR